MYYMISVQSKCRWTKRVFIAFGKGLLRGHPGGQAHSTIAMRELVRLLEENLKLSSSDSDILDRLRNSTILFMFLLFQQFSAIISAAYVRPFKWVKIWHVCPE